MYNLPTCKFRSHILKKNGYFHLQTGFLLFLKNHQQNWLVVSNIFYFHPHLGKSSNLTNIFFRWVETTNKKSEVNIHVNDGAYGKPRNLLLLGRRKETLIPQELP